jgi:hypothetical protein
MISTLQLRITLKTVLAASALLPLTTWAGFDPPLTQIKVDSSLPSLWINSKAYENGSAVASGGWAGAWKATLVGGYVPDEADHDTYWKGKSWTAFCMDLGNTMSAGTWDYQANPFSAATDTGNNNGTAPDPGWASPTSGNKAAWVYNQFYDRLGSTAYDPQGDNRNHTYTEAEKNAAMALSIWELLYEGSGTYNVASSSAHGKSYSITDKLQLNTPQNSSDWAALLANYWLGEFTTRGNTDIQYMWWKEMEPYPGSGSDVQSLLGPVPEPSTIIAGALLLLPLAASTVRSARRRAL